MPHRKFPSVNQKWKLPQINQMTKIELAYKDLLLLLERRLAILISSIVARFKHGGPRG
jgi:hypothetical protein